MAFQSKIKSAAQPCRRPVGADRKGRAFDREAELPKLIGLWPAELRDTSLAATEKIVSLLKKAIRAERRRGQAGHWTYDLTRHLALLDALKVEEGRLGELSRRERADRFRRDLAARGLSAGGLPAAAGGAEFVGDADG